MPLSKNIGSYRDCRAAFLTANKEGFIKITFPTYGKAHHFRQRAYNYRKLLHAKQAETTVEGVATETPFDHLKLYLTGPFNNELVIEVNEVDAVVTDINGNPIDLTVEEADEPELDLDAIEEAAKELKDLGLDLG